VRLPPEERPAAIAYYNGSLLVGTILGVGAGGALDALLPTLLQASAAPGLMAAALSGLQALLLTSLFSDPDVLPSAAAPKGAAGAKGDGGDSTDPGGGGGGSGGLGCMLIGILSLLALCSLGLEGLVPLLAFDGYGWQPDATTLCVITRAPASPCPSSYPRA
jgi:hypothetical protein